MMEKILAIAKEAGEIILRQYRKPHAIQIKDDNSPLTQADLASSRFISESLRFSGFPVLCEESVVEYGVRKTWTRFWMVDPLDGTREFLEGNGEFTVNIALIDHGRPLLGVVYAPAMGVLGWAEENKGAYQMTSDGTPLRLNSALSDPCIGVCSRSHDSPEVESFYRRNGITKNAPVGSSLKFLRVAEGKAGLYARFSGSKEWDTAAGHIILVEAGGWILGNESRKVLTYNKNDLRNDVFIAGSANRNPGELLWNEPPPLSKRSS
jgi:3'(2'), 5'-bisphosphate nucleotidase